MNGVDIVTNLCLFYIQGLLFMLMLMVVIVIMLVAVTMFMFVVVMSMVVLTVKHRPWVDQSHAS